MNENTYLKEEVVKLKAPSGKQTTTINFGFSFACLIFCFLVPVFKKDFKQAILYFLLFLTCLMIGILTGFYVLLLMLVVFYAMKYNEWYLKKRLSQGWKPVKDSDFSALEEKGYITKDIFGEKFFASIIHGENERRVYFRYGLGFSYFVFCTAMGAFLIWAYKQPRPQDSTMFDEIMMRLMLPVGVLIFSVGAVLMLLRLLRFKPLLVLNSKGVSTYITPVNYATIAWKDIQHISVFSEGRYRIIGISLYSFEDFKVKQSFWARVFLRLKSGYPPQVRIAEHGLNGSIEEIFSLEDEAK